MILARHTLRHQLAVDGEGAGSDGGHHVSRDTVEVGSVMGNQVEVALGEGGTEGERPPVRAVCFKCLAEAF